MLLHTTAKKVVLSRVLKHTSYLGVALRIAEVVGRVAVFLKIAAPWVVAPIPYRHNSHAKLKESKP
jgi:hypothetical protein